MIKLPWRRERVPDQVRAAIRLMPAERVLAAAQSDHDRYLVASDRALFVVENGDSHRFRWDLVDKATWEPPSLSMEVRSDPDSQPGMVSFEVDTDVDLPAVVRDRVTNSIVTNSRVAVRGGYARVLARRNPDTGLLQWRIIFAEGVDSADPEVQAVAQAELADLRSRLGV